MVPVWILIPVLVAGVLVGAGLGWWMRQRMLAAALPPEGAAEHPYPPEKVAEPEPSPPEPVAVAAPILIDLPSWATVGAAAPQPEPRPRPEPVVIDLPRPQPAARAVEATIAPPKRPAAAPQEDTDHEDEALGVRMENVLSELERRYEGRRAAPGETPREPSAPARPRRRRRPS